MSDLLMSLKNAGLTLKGNAGPVRILSGIDLSISAGESIGLIGRSGSGKSSMLMLLCGLERATEGTIRVCSQDLTNMNEDALASVGEEAKVLDTPIGFDGSVQDR